MKPRSYIDETIQCLERSAKKIQEYWNKFKAGEISKEEFEDEYRSVLVDWVKDETENEIYEPNGLCKYQNTNPDCQYFIEQNY
jgi:hypothetical protein